MPATNRSLAEVDYALLAAPVFGTLRGAFDVADTVDLAQLARGYRHQPESDLYRVKLHELKDEDAPDFKAKLWLFEAAARALSAWIELDDDAIAKLKPGASPDAFRFDGKPVVARQEEVANRLHHPFSKTHQHGTFAENIRVKINPKKLDELRESMQAFGWIDHHPAILDEHGVIIVGHRRMHVAKELGIEPKVVRIKFGYGDQGDAERLRLALASNLGNEPLNTDDRRTIAARFLLEKNDKGEPAWSVREIAKILQVAKSTVDRDRQEMQARERAAALAASLQQPEPEPEPAPPPPAPWNRPQDPYRDWVQDRLDAASVPMTKSELESIIHEALDYLTQPQEPAYGLHTQ